MQRRTLGSQAIGLLLVLLASAAPGAAAGQAAWHPSKYGASDTLGALNNLGPADAARAARLVREGKAYALGVQTGPQSPAYGERRYQVEISPPPGAAVAPVGANKVTAHDERVTTSMGIGTQLDGLGHLGIDHRYYNGLTGQALNTPEGFRLDLSNLPAVVTRGVVIDMARHFGVPRLEAGQAFNRPEIEAAMRAQGVTVGRGDVVLFHTGWMSIMDTDKARYASSEPGLGEAGANWLASLGVVAVGADTLALEPLPSVDPNRPFVVHQTLLAKHGVYILENINTAPLVRDEVTEFMFVLGAPRFVGTVQVVVNPVAIR
jgi:kynurenine formamidase